jgi:hypothetical protein
VVFCIDLIPLIRGLLPEVSMIPVFAIYGNVAGAIILVLSLTAAVIVGLYVLAFAAHCLVTVVEGTAAGNDAITWPDEPIADWIARGVFFAALLLVWAGPAAIASRALREDWLPDNGSLRFILLAVSVLWLLFPVGLLSSLSAESKWMIFRPSIVGVLLRVLPSTLMFYFLTALVAAVTAFVWYLAVCRLQFAFLPLAAPLGAAGFLLYSRLLGRLSLMIHRRNPTKAERDEKPKKKKKRRPPEGKAPAPRADLIDGWDPQEEAVDLEVVEEETEDLEEVEESAEGESSTAIMRDPSLDLPSPLASADAPAPEPEPAFEQGPAPDASDEFPLKPLERDEEFDNRWAKELEEDDGPADPYDVSREAPPRTPEYRPVEDYDLEEMGPQSPVEQRTGDGIVTKLDMRREQQRRRRKRRLAPAPPPPPGPRYVWWQGLYTFPFYPTSLGAWMWLTVGFMVFGLCFGLAIANYPSGE